jgi:hypothetical protein
MCAKLTYLLDSRGLSCDQQIEHRIDILVKSNLGLVESIEVQQNGALGTALGNVLVLALLSQREVVVLVKEAAEVDRIGFAIPRSDDADTATGNVAETEMEAPEFRSDNEEHAEKRGRVLCLGQERRVKPERNGYFGGLIEVGLEDVLVEGEEGFEDDLFV